MEPQPSAAELFISYAHEDERLCEQLHTHLASLRCAGLIKAWYDRDISAGAEWHGEVIAHLRKARIVLLLVSPDFMASGYINGVEIKEALARQAAGVARVIPVILRPVDWKGAPFSHLQALPTHARPVTSWRSRDRAWVDVVQGIREVIQGLPDPPDGCWGVPDIPRAPLVGYIARKDRSGHDLLKQLKDELAPGKPGFVMLSGLEGVWKSKLAAEVARQLEADYQRCVVWSDAGKRVDYTLHSLLDDIAAQLGRSDLNALAPDAKEERVGALVAQQPTLVVFDNYEKLAADVRGQIDALLGKARCTVLYISLRRKEVGKTTLVTFTVPPMWPDEADELIRRLVELTQNPEIFTAGIRLRIREVSYGRPALIELVVGQIDAGAEEPSVIFKKLSRGEGGALQAIFKRSWEAMGKDGRATLLALPLFPSSATREALGAVVGLNEHRFKEAINDLRTLMMVEIEVQGEHFRLSIKGITRKLAEKLLSKDRRALAKYWRHFVSYYKVQVDKFDWAKCGPLAAPVAEKSNILRAMQFASYIGDWDTVMELYCKTKGSIHSFNVWRRAIDLAERGAEETLGDDESLPLPKIIQIKHKETRPAQKCYGELKKKSGKTGEKILKEFARNPKSVLKMSDLPVVIELSVVEFESGVFAYHKGRQADAGRHYEKAKQYKELAKDRRGFATVCNNLGVALAKQGRCKEALAEFKRSLETFEQLGSKFTKVVSQNIKWLRGAWGKELPCPPR